LYSIPGTAEVFFFFFLNFRKYFKRNWKIVLISVSAKGSY
jgi:hypothetical protein